MGETASRASSEPAGGGGAVSLPVLASPTIRPSRSGRRRAIVLAAVQIAMILHLVMWLLSRRYGWFGGYTTTPIEPSESMEFVKHGVVNAGLIFFAIAILSTLVLGRWFCGWGCHLVMLQDLCGWIMRRCGVRPRPFRSRLLVYVPLILALYMFIWPAVYRWGHALGRSLGWIETTIPPWQLGWELTTTEFWRTFPGVLVAIPFLGICGFATVYFLGSKGFCTYGCPYGGFFAPVDRLSPARIRVTDACEHCGHCTAVCTSNVRVHDEVKRYGMVVDSGCMKCLDCVSVCPNDALYFGFGAPALGARPSEKAPDRRPDLSWPEEIAFAAVFGLSFFAVRGVYGLVPMLMAAGVAGCVTFLAWKGWRLVRDRDVSFARSRLKHRGRLTGRGMVFAATALLALAFTVHSGVVSGARRLAQHHDDRVVVGRSAVLDDPAYAPDPDTRRHAGRALGLYRLASGFDVGGVGFPAPWQADIDMRRAWLHATAGDLEAAERVLAAAIERDGPSDRFCANLGDVIRARGDVERVAAYYREQLLAREAMPRTLDGFVRWSVAAGDTAGALDLVAQRQERFPDDAPTLGWLALLQLETGRTEEGIATLREAADRNPDDVGTRRTLAVALGDAGRFAEALEAVQSAIALTPRDPGLHLLAARIVVQLGDAELAARALRRAVELAPDDPEVRFEAAGLFQRIGLPEEAASNLQRAQALRGGDG
jgi:tetratricopeptide (TPR) repeat protein/NAD-dependent dihydropyrimidine dehydrogenase PreA subunit